MILSLFGCAGGGNNDEAAAAATAGLLEEIQAKGTLTIGIEGTESYGAEIQGTDGFSQSIELVLAGRADATLNDDVTFYDYKKAKPDAKVKIVATSDEVNVSGVMIKFVHI